MSGRKAIFEALILDDEMKWSIKNAHRHSIYSGFRAFRGERSLFSRKQYAEAAAGVISLEEPVIPRGGFYRLDRIEPGGVGSDPGRGEEHFLWTEVAQGHLVS